MLISDSPRSDWKPLASGPATSLGESGFQTTSSGEQNAADTPRNGRALVRVLVVEDHPLMARAIRETLAAEAWIEVVGCTATADDAIAVVTTAHPHVVILDLKLKGSSSSGIFVARQILERTPSVGIVVHTAHVSDASVKELARIGVLGCVSKSEATEVLIAAVNAASRGHTFYSSEVRALAHATHTPYEEGARAISSREVEVIQLIADGYTNPEIARALSISVSTVINLASSASRKLAVPRGNRTVLTLRALRTGMIVVDR